MRIAILYATREGQTRRIAEYLAGAFHARDVPAEIFDVRETPEVDVDVYDALIVAASVHLGSFEREMIRFVKRHRDSLERIPTSFLAVSMSAASLGDPGRTPRQRENAKRDTDYVLERFIKRTAWRPHHVHHVAGAILYTRYNFLLRFVMKKIAQAAGSNTDTTRDHEYTDWPDLERFASKITGELGSAGAEAGQSLSP
jgi:menaquinone-dependent protoporphyrinogen oxidase